MQRRELRFVSAGTHLAGTLTLPDGDGPWPAIVTLHGASGGTRDFRLFLHLEALLVPAGFAVLRYDRRGSGASEGDFMIGTRREPWQPIPGPRHQSTTSWWVCSHMA